MPAIPCLSSPRLRVSAVQARRFTFLKTLAPLADAMTVAKLSGVRRTIKAKNLSTAETKMVLAGANRPLSELEDLELRRHRLAELITLELVSPSLTEQIKKAVTQLDQQISAMKQQPMQRIAA